MAGLLLEQTDKTLEIKVTRISDFAPDIRKCLNYLQHSGCRPQQLFVVVTPHNPHQLEWSLAGQNNELALLVAVGQYLQTVSDDGEKFDVVPLEKGHHLLYATGETDSHFGAWKKTGSYS